MVYDIARGMVDMPRVPVHREALTHHHHCHEPETRAQMVREQQQQGPPPCWIPGSPALSPLFSKGPDWISHHSLAAALAWLDVCPACLPSQVMDLQTLSGLKLKESVTTLETGGDSRIGLLCALARGETCYLCEG